MLPTLRAGAERCAERLGRICRAEWRVASLAADAQALGDIAALLELVAEDHYGSYCSMPAAAFLVVLDRKSGMRVASRFTGAFGDRLDAEEDLESKALPEVANVTVNAMAGALAGREGSVISVPVPLLDSPRELLQGAFKRFSGAETVGLACLVRLACPELQSAMTMLVLLAKAETAAAGS